MTLHIAQQIIRAITAERLCSLAVVSLMDNDIFGTPAESLGILDRSEVSDSVAVGWQAQSSIGSAGRTMGAVAPDTLQARAAISA